MADIVAAMETFQRFVAENPYSGTTYQIIALSLGIAEASNRLDTSTFRLYAEQSGIADKLFSKLKVIGKTLLSLQEKERRDVVKQLPASYSTIHVLCSLTAEELVTGARTGAITPSMSVRAAKDYTKQVRFPALAAADGEKRRWGTKQEHLYSVYRPEVVALGTEELQSLQKALRKACEEYGVVLRVASTDGTRSLKQQERAEREVFWRGVLERELTGKWFTGIPDELKKQFNLKTIGELHETPLRSFTGFLINADGGKKEFWERHGQAYVAKLNYLMEKTEDRAQRFNLKRRLENVVAERRELAIWKNTLLEQIGFIYQNNKCT